MNLRHQVAPDCPITLRYGEERDRDFLAAIFTEVWATIPDKDKNAILSRGFGSGITVDVTPAEAMQGFNGLSDMGCDIRLNRSLVDFYPRYAVVHVAAHELAHKVDDAAHATETGTASIARMNEPRRNAERRVATILKRWGYLAKAGTVRTQADEERIAANLETRKETQP